ncbi:MAG: hypothetical protein OXG24_04045 [Gammaproteobacteria bacterium]|nr:hypothetical protein [Gammaproteobacteria bacterium]
MATKTRKIPGLDELIRNQEEFTKQRAILKRKHCGKFAIFCQGELKGIADSKEDAYRTGYSECGDQKFTLHEIGEKPQSTGSARAYTLEELQADGLV